VALNFKMLSSIYSGRIDLGLARAFVPEHISCFLTADYKEPALTWADKVDQLFSFLNTHESEKSLIKPIIIPPQGAALPVTWFLGSSEFSIENAISHKSNFCLSFMHPGSNYEKNKDVIKKFKEKYYKVHGEVPLTAVLIASSFQSAGEELKRFNPVYDGASIINPIGSADFIVGQLDKMLREIENDEFVLFSPVANRELRKEFFQTIMPKWKEG
jgi:alkanesulfonate monooxygenase SsuD/methylene tetrahydromethanopterin reductase-like flavin-dependent oxidoreductase (luciferase family)